MPASWCCEHELATISFQTLDSKKATVSIEDPEGKRYSRGGFRSTVWLQKAQRTTVCPPSQLHLLATTSDCTSETSTEWNRTALLLHPRPMAIIQKQPVESTIEKRQTSHQETMISLSFLHTHLAPALSTCHRYNVTGTVSLLAH